MINKIDTGSNEADISLSNKPSLCLHLPYIAIIPPSSIHQSYTALPPYGPAVLSTMPPQWQLLYPWVKHQREVGTTNGISIEFEFRSKFVVLWFKTYSTDHNEIMHTSRQCNCRDVWKISLWSVKYTLN